MPTVGWILEDAEEKYWEKVVSFPVQQFFLCPYCEYKFISQEELNDHLAATHFLDIPRLLIHGHQITSQSIIRNRLLENEVLLINSTHCRLRVNGGQAQHLTPMEFREHFLNERYSHWDVTLINSPGQGRSYSECEFKIDFQIPEKRELDNTDHLFIQYLAISSPKHSDIEQFMSSCEISPQGRDYIGALTDYVVGLMIKDRDSSLITTVSFEEYKTKFLASRNVLNEFPRPVPQAIVSCIDFNLNGFTRIRGQCLVGSLQAGHYLLAAIANLENFCKPDKARTPLTTPVCPVDNLTAKLLSLCEKYLASGPINIEQAQFLEELPYTQAVSEYDLPKIYVLCSLVYLKNGKRIAAERNLKKLQFDSLFGSWARQNLEQMNATH